MSLPRETARTLERHCNSLQFVEFLADLYLGEETGRLEVRAPASAAGVLVFDRGLLCSAEGVGREEDPGALLVASGELDQKALDAAREKGGEGLEVLKGLVEEAALLRTVRVAARAVVRRIVAQPACTAFFEAGEPPPETPESDVLFTVEALIGGVRSASGFEMVGGTLASLRSRVSLRPHRPFPLEKLALDPIQGFLLSRLDGSLSVSEALSALPPDQDQVGARFVVGLAMLGVAAFDPPVGEGRFRVAHLLGEGGDVLEERAARALDALIERVSGATSPAQTLGVEAGATEEETRRAYHELRMILDRVRAAPALLRERRRDVRMIESRLTEAVLSLSAQNKPQPAPDDKGPDWGSIQARREYEKTQTRKSEERDAVTAETLYLRAKKAFGVKDFHTCIQYLLQAVRLCDHVDRYHFLLGEARAMNPERRWQKNAELDFLRAIELDPFNADYLVSLARLYRRQGLSLRAKQVLEKALTIEPSHDVATTELAELSDP